MTTSRLCRAALLVALTALPAPRLAAAPPPPSTDETAVTVTLVDGSELSGVISLRDIVLETEFGSVRVELRRLRSLVVGPPTQVETTAGLQFVGTLQLPELELRTRGGHRTLALHEFVRLVGTGAAAARVGAGPRALAALEYPAGTITLAESAAGLRLHVRPPTAWEGGPLPALVLLHSADATARDYVSTVAAAWPELAAAWLLVGIDGEQVSTYSREARPAFNYTYADYGGPGLPGLPGLPGPDTEQSPELVAASLAELRAQLPVTRIVLCGHAQGGSLAYLLGCFHPELVDGVVAVSCGLPAQCAPDFQYLAAHPELTAAHQQLAVALVHGQQDELARYVLATAARDSLEARGLPHVRLFTDAAAGHRFAMLPVDEAVLWVSDVLDALDALPAAQPETSAEPAEPASER